MNVETLSAEHLLELDPVEWPGTQPQMAIDHTCDRALVHRGRVLAIWGELWTSDAMLELWAMLDRRLSVMERVCVMRAMRRELETRFAEFPVFATVARGWAPGETLAQALGFVRTELEVHFAGIDWAFWKR